MRTFYRLLLAAFLLSILSAQAAETRALKIIATDPATKQSSEVAFYNKTYAVIIGIDQYAHLPADSQLRLSGCQNAPVAISDFSYVIANYG